MVRVHRSRRLGQQAPGSLTRAAPHAPTFPHASYPAVTTRIDEDEVDLPGGRLACLRYTVEDGHQTSTSWFARSLPGPPVKVIKTLSGRVVQTTELVLRRPG